MSATTTTSSSDLTPNDILEIISAFFNALRTLLKALGIMKDDAKDNTDTKKDK